MKTLYLLVIALLAGTGIGRAQNVTITNAGWFSIESIQTLGITNDVAGTDENIFVPANISAMNAPPPSIAEAMTPRIQALADGLQRDPLRISNYVHDHIRYVLYFGSKKGAELTLLEKSGNDFDQCALLVALLRAAGLTNAAYQFGWMLLPYDNPDGSHRDLRHWLNLSLTNSNWSLTSAYLTKLFVELRSYPIVAANFDNNTFAFQRVWVTVTVGGTTYYLDPAFKVSEPIPGLDLSSAMGFNSNALLNAAGGSEVGNAAANFYVTNLNEAALRGTLAGYTTNLLSYIQSNQPNASVEQITGGHSIVPSTNAALSQTLLFPTTNLYGTMPVINWVNQPTNLMSTFAVSYLGTNYQWFMPQLQGQRLSLTVSSGGSAQLWQEDALVSQRGTGGGIGTFDVVLTVGHPRGGWNTVNNVFIPGTFFGKPSAKLYQKANATYAILYAFDPDWGWLQERENKLAAYRQQGLSDTSRQVVSETLNVMGLNWQLQVESIGRMLAQQIGALPMYYHRMGRMSQESGFGYYVDIYLAATGCYSSSSPTDNHQLQWLDQVSYFASAMEHGLIEQQQDASLVAASTIKILQLANTNHQAVYMANKTNWTIIQSRLVNYNAGSLSGLGSILNQGYTMLLPRNGLTQLAGSGSWSGYGLLGRSSAGGMQMLIGDSSGVHCGGYVSDFSATVNTHFVSQSSYSQPTFFNASPSFVPSFTGADPVNMADGTFQMDSTDLTLGQTEPRGLHLARHYSSRRRNSNLAGLSPGWLHNYYLNVATVSAPQAGLGGTTPAQMAAMLVATTAANGFYNGDQPSPRNWTITALIAKWGIDQLTGKAVTVALGKDTIQFIQQPDGSYTPPAHCTMTLTQNGAGYDLQERHGRTFQFNSAGWATSILDPYAQFNQGLSLAYNSSNWVTTVRDWKGRTLTFTYSASAPQRLASVTDNTGRSITLAYSSGGDLISATDPESKTNKFLYDTNHQITATFNALGQLVVSNVYDNFGRVTTQYTGGDTSKTWKIFWGDGQTVEQDPSGGRRTFFYDDQSRLIALRDALGQVSRTFYDGQDHMVMTVSPLSETNRFIYDGAHKVIHTIDPLGFTNQFIYDSENNLIRTIDARGGASSFGYNAVFQLIGATNAAGDWMTYTYNALDGLLSARADPGGTTTYDYDIWYGQLSTITYPGSLGGEGYLYNPLGDVLSHTNARGFVTSFQYNARRELTNAVAPTNLAARVAYDAADNILSTTDARGFSTTNFWSPTRKLLGTVFPVTPQGAPIRTNLYDVRDWLSRTTRLGYDADGRNIAATNAAGEVTRQTWNQRSELLHVTTPASTTIKRAYDAAGNATILTNRNGKKWQFQFDAANRLTNTLTPLGRSTVLTYDNRGLLASVKEPGGDTVTLAYDARQRLTNATFTSYTYDARNRLVGTLSTASVTYSYDPLGHRAALTNGTNVTRFVINPNAALSQVLLRVKSGVTNYYVHGLGLLYEADDAGNTRTYHCDYRGSTVAITDGSGNVTDRAEYSAYGMVTYRVGSTDTPFLYNGRFGVQTDANGLLQMRARYYNPYLGRFLNADPSGFSGGLNAYAYADGNPASMLDPLGLGALESGGGSWLSQALAGTAAGDWVSGFDRGLQAWAAGNDPSRYTPSGSDAYQAGITSGYNAVPSAIEVASFVALAGVGSGGTRSASSALRTEGALAANRAPVFWSGGRAAEDAARTFANANSGIVIGDTAAGRVLAQSTAGVPWSQARPQWLNLSQDFARSASGEVNVFQNARGLSVDSIWRSEYQTLMQNPNVTRINFNVVIPNGSVVPVP